MKINRNKTYKLLAIVLILTMTFLAGCDGSTPVNACHATGDPANPYEEITIDSRATAEEHLAHPGDFYPVPEGGCPTSPAVVIDNQITICHATSSNSNPYNEITVSVNGLNGHGKHEGDIIPAPEGGCPTGELEIIEDQISICHATGDETNPYDEISVSINGMDGHDQHEGDIIPAPAGGCPTSPLVVVEDKITICHATSSEKNPYNEITVSINGLNGHASHEGDIIPAPVGGCPTSELEIIEDQISICHATGDETNPYDEITVHVNGLDGHVTHEGDIVPAPVGGCPTSPLVIVDGKVSICHATSRKTNPYNEISVSVNGLNGHDKHEGDLVPAPVSGCPSSVLEIVDDKIIICHATDIENNPYNQITVSVNGFDGHDKHDSDIIPAPVGGCPSVPVNIESGKITICHATGSKKNPYKEISVSVNGLNGHDKHEKDIIPAPGGGCPSTK